VLSKKVHVLVFYPLLNWTIVRLTLDLTESILNYSEDVKVACM